MPGDGVNKLDKLELAQCPFLKQRCIGDRCQLWTRFGLRQPGTIVGTQQVIEGQNCIFNVLGLFLARAQFSSREVNR